MSHESTIRTVRATLVSVFVEVDVWLESDLAKRMFNPVAGGWSIDQVLEHIALTNRFLLLTLRKSVGVAEKRARRGDLILQGESDLTRLLVIGERGSFNWVRPEHMEPSGGLSTAEVRSLLNRQLSECLSLLERISDGVGTLCLVTMTVNNLGKIDLYQWLFFFAQHARRHLSQLFAIEAEFLGRVGERVGGPGA